MGKPNLPLAVSVFLLLANIPSATAASQGIIGHLDSGSVQAPSTNSIHGDLIALTRGEPGGTYVNSANFSITGSVQARTYSVNPAISYAAVYRTPEKQDQDFGAATVRGQINRPDYQLSFFANDPAVSVRLTSNCSTIQPSHASEVERHNQVPDTSAPESTMSAQTSSALQWSPCHESSGQIVAQGNFTVMLWQWDSEVSSNHRTTLLPSGHSRYEHDPIGSAETINLIAHDRQVYLYVTNGIFTMPLGNDATTKIYLADARGHADGGFTLNQVRGTLTDGTRSVPVDAGEVAISGPTDLRMEGRDVNSPIQVSFAAPPSAIRVDGTALVTYTAATPGIAVWLVGFGTVLAPTVVAFSLVRRRMRRIRPLRRQQLVMRSHDLIDGLRLKEADAVTAKAVDLDAGSLRVQFLRATLLASQGDAEGALARHRLAAKLPSLDAEWRGENAFHAALLLARSASADDTEILGWLREAVRFKPSLQWEMGMHDELRPYLQQLEWEAGVAELLQP